MATLRNLKIKTSSCKRIVKELHSYGKEVEREAAKTAEMKGKGSDPYDLKQQSCYCWVVLELAFSGSLFEVGRRKCAAESRMMIPDCHKRLEAALADLKATLVELEESDRKEGPEIEDARSTITEFAQLFQATDA
ncbi:hypothetical protein GH714_021431 [Hevea brasiliensis]|uniref:Tubulin-specific chaperone A n=1 Tax=Hevea brasiliensis TaxID=3981 RepID=A0A6A6M493_HEVBR|nr:hypothetical protein GH714_021431 [Hevea brasiliensis]